MTEDPTVVWISDADPAVISADDILDLVKIIGEVESVRLHYHPEKRTTQYRVQFKKASSAQTVLHLEGMKYKDCELHFWSAVYGSLPAPPSQPAVEDSHPKSNASKTARSDGGANGTRGKRGRDEPDPRFAATNTSANTVLPCNHLLPEELRLDQALVKPFATLRSLSDSMESGATPPSEIPVEEMEYLRQQFGAEMIPLLRQFQHLQEAFLDAVERRQALQQEKTAVEEEMASVLRAAATPKPIAVALPPHVLMGLPAIESLGEAQAAEGRRVGNKTMLSSTQAHPASILLALARVCGPVTQFVVKDSADVGHAGPGKQFRFSLVVEFLSEANAKRAVDLLSGNPVKDVGRKPTTVRSDEDDLKFLASLAKGEWGPVVSQLRRKAPPPELLRLDEATLASWANDLTL